MAEVEGDPKLIPIHDHEIETLPPNLRVDIADVVPPPSSFDFYDLGPHIT
jgi:hypothetical protein